jgi:cellulose synthase A
MPCLCRRRQLQFGDRSASTIKGSPRVAGDDDEEDIDDLEHEFNIDDEKQRQLEGNMQNSQITEAMLHGKMSYGRGADDGEGNNTPQMPPIITGARSVPVCIPPSKSSPGI